MGDLDATTARLAALLVNGGTALRDPTRGDLVFESGSEPALFERLPGPVEAWAVDGGQSLVADARCLQLYVTRAATVHWRDGSCVSEDEGELRPFLLGGGDEREALAALGAPIGPAAAIDVNLLRDWGEWQAVQAAVDRADPGALVLVDGDLLPDWRIDPVWVAALLERAVERGVVLAGVTKHSSLSRGGAPLLGQLEREAAERFGPRARWWAHIAGTHPECGPGLAVVVARLDPDARFSFRVDVPAGTDIAAALGAMAALADDAAFPGYPYPLSVADRLAACPGWVRSEIWDRVSAGLDRAGVPSEVTDRAFADRHRLMERP